MHFPDNVLFTNTRQTLQFMFEVNAEFNIV